MSNKAYKVLPNTEEDKDLSNLAVTALYKVAASSNSPMADLVVEAAILAPATLVTQVVVTVSVAADVENVQVANTVANACKASRIISTT